MILPPVQQTLQPIKNWAYDPSFFNDNASAGSNMGFTSISSVAAYTTALSSVDTPAGTYRSRTDTLTESGAYGRRWNHNATIPLRVGDVIRVAFWFRASFAAIANPYLEFSTSGGGYGGAASSGQLKTVVPNTWYRLTYTHTVANSAHAFLRSTANYTSTAPAAAIGNQVSFAGLVITVNQPLPEVHCDGATAGWKWLGNPGASPSAGWPNMYATIAGPAMADLTGNNVTASISGDAFDGFTMYHVYDAFTPGATWTTLWTVHGADGPTGWSTTGAMSYGRRGTLDDYTYSHSRFGTSVSGNNQSAIAASIAPTRRGFTPGRHIVAQTVSFAGSSASCTTMIDGLADDTVANLSKGTGIGRSGIKVRSGGSSTEGADGSANAMPIRTLYFPAVHTRTTRLAIAKWLASAYGVPFS